MAFIKTLPAAFLFCVSTLSFAVEVDLGDRTITIPEPDGFVHVTSDLVLLNQILDVITSPGIHRLASFIPEEEMARTLKEEQIDLNRRATVCLSPEIANRSISVEEFNDFARSASSDASAQDANLAQKFLGSAERINKKSREVFGIDPNISMSEPIVFPYHEISKQSIAYSMLAKVSNADPNQTEQVKVNAVTATYLHVKDTILFLYVTGDGNDLGWTRSLSKKWSDEILATNVSDYAEIGHKRYAVVRHFHSRSNAYSLELPGKWVQMPTDVLRRFRDAVLSDDAKFILEYEAGFQKEDADAWLQYPYIIVQVIPYVSLGMDRQIYRSEAKELLSTLIGRDPTQLRDGLSPLSQTAVESVTPLHGVFEADNMRSRIFLDMSVKGTGDIKGELMGYFGKDAFIQIGFYDRASSWASSAKDCEYMLSSFAFDPCAEYDRDRASPTLSEKLGKITLFGSFALLVLLSGVAIFGLIGRQKPTPTSRVDSQGPDSQLQGQPEAGSLGPEEQVLIEICDRRIRYAFFAGVAASVLNLLAAVLTSNGWYLVDSGLFLLLALGIRKGSRLSGAAILVLTAVVVLSKIATLQNFMGESSSMVGVVIYGLLGWFFFQGTASAFIRHRTLIKGLSASEKMGNQPG